jgi:hypothetical protein
MGSFSSTCTAPLLALVSFPFWRSTTARSTAGTKGRAFLPALHGTTAALVLSSSGAQHGTAGK